MRSLSLLAVLLVVGCGAGVEPPDARQDALGADARTLILTYAGRTGGCAYADSHTAKVTVDRQTLAIEGYAWRYEPNEIGVLKLVEYTTTTSCAGDGSTFSCAAWGPYSGVVFKLATDGRGKLGGTVSMRTADAEGPQNPCVEVRYSVGER